MKLPYKILHPSAKPPSYAHETDAGMDITGFDPVTKQNTAVYSTGLAFDVPVGYVLLIFSRSGHGFKENTRLANAVGVVDAGYHGEVKIKLTRDDMDVCQSYDFPASGSRIAQAVLMRLPKTEPVEVEEFKTESERKEKGFGSTGE